jgi:hypothetical protein
VKYLLLPIVVFFLSGNLLKAQDEPKVIQFSGYVMTSDSLQGLPFVHIINLETGMGITSKADGFFSIVGREGDRIRFSSVGYNADVYTIPENMEGYKYSIIKLLTKDTVYIPETVIYPWPTIQEFKVAFLNLDLSDEDFVNAFAMDPERMAQLAYETPLDGKETSSMYLRAEAQKYYYNGQAQPIMLTNPFAWAQFIKAWQNGQFKRK